MAANRQQGGYVAEFIVAFTVFPLGLVLLISAGRALGALLALVGLGLLVHAGAGFYRIKKLEFSDPS